MKKIFFTFCVLQFFAIHLTYSQNENCMDKVCAFGWYEEEIAAIPFKGKDFTYVLEDLQGAGDMGYHKAEEVAGKILPAGYWYYEEFEVGKTVENADGTTTTTGNFGDLMKIGKAPILHIFKRKLTPEQWKEKRKRMKKEYMKKKYDMNRNGTFVAWSAGYFNPANERNPKVNARMMNGNLEIIAYKLIDDLKNDKKDYLLITLPLEEGDYELGANPPIKLNLSADGIDYGMQRAIIYGTFTFDIDDETNKGYGGFEYTITVDGKNHRINGIFEGVPLPGK
jgi:hypothetical protein